MDITVLNSLFQPIYIVDSYQSMIWTDRYDKCGDFEFYTKWSAEIQQYMVPGNYIQIKDSDRTMIIESVEIESDIEEGTKFVAKGRSLESILDRRIVWGLKTLTGNIQTCIKTLINESIISPSNAKRKIDNFAFEDSTDSAITGISIDVQYTGTNLYDAITDLCSSNDIGFKTFWRTGQYGTSINLLNWNNWKTVSVVNGTATWNHTERSITLSASSNDCYTPINVPYFPRSAKIPCLPNTKYTLSWKHTTSSSNIWVGLFENGELTNVAETSNKNVHKVTLTTTSDASFLTFGLGAQNKNDVVKYYDIQIEQGSTASPYEPYDHTHEATQMVFKLFKGIDRSYSQSSNSYVVFSPNFDNISESNYIEDHSPYKNVALIKGQDVETEEGTNTPYESVEGNYTGLNRRELFVDGSSISHEDEEGETLTDEEYSALLIQLGNDELSKLPISKAFDGSADTTLMYQYGVDFFIGDKVQLEDSYGHTGESIVTEFIISVDDSGYSAYPTFEAIQS